jgi:hypothetical protein
MCEIHHKLRSMCSTKQRDSLGDSSSNKVPSSEKPERARVIFTPSCGFKHRCDSAVTRLALIRVGEFQRAITPEEEYLDTVRTIE